MNFHCLVLSVDYFDVVDTPKLTLWIQEDSRSYCNYYSYAFQQGNRNYTEVLTEGYFKLGSY